MAVGGTNDKLKWWIFKKGLRLELMFWEKIGLEGTCSLSDLLNRVEPYMNWEKIS